MIAERISTVNSSEAESPLFQIERELSQLFDENERHLTHPGNGKFNTLRQAARHLHHLSYLSKEEADQIFRREFSADAKGFYFEVIKEEPLLRYFVDFRDRKLICTEYGDKTLEEISRLANERDGAVMRAINTLEKRLEDSNHGDFFLFTSPPGWHGMKDLNGGNLMEPHQESQTWLFYKDQNEGLVSATIRTNMTADQSAEFLRSVQKDLLLGPFEDERDKLMGITETVAGSYANSFEEAANKVIEKMQVVMDTKTAFANDKTGVKHSFSDLKAKVKNIDKQFLLKADIDEIIVQIYTDTLNMDIQNKEDVRKFVLTIGEGILEMNALADGIKGETREEVTRKSNQSLSEKSGCPPSISRAKLSTSELRRLGYKESGYCRLCKRNSKWVGPCNICYACELKL